MDESPAQPEPLPQSEPAHAFKWPPIPDEELQAGVTLTAERLLEMGAMRGDPASASWRFRLMSLATTVEEVMNASGKKVSVRTFKNGLHINTAAEGSEYHDGTAHGAVRKVKRHVNKLATRVDVSNLSSAQQAKHDRNLCLWGVRIVALDKVLPKLMADEAEKNQ